MLVNSAITIYQGSSSISKVYQGNTIVWQKQQPTPTYVNYIYTTQNDGMDYYINTGIIPSTADTLDIIWRCHYQGGYHICTCNEATGSTWYNWRVFVINNNLYYDYNTDSTRIYKSSFAPATTDVLNWKIGNWYIKNNADNTYIISGATQSVIGSNLNYPYAFGLGQGYLKEYKITRNGNVIFDGKAALDSAGTPCLYDTVSQTYKYYNGTQAYLAYEAEPVPTGSTNIIYYTSTDGNIVTPYSSGTDVFGANIVSNTYSGGQGQIVFDGNVTEIGYNAFAHCTSLIGITIPNSVTSIGERAFYSCTNLREITIPNAVTSIGKYAFCGDVFLSSITISNSVTTIGNNAFENTGIYTFVIPNSISSISGAAFKNCLELSSITIPSSVTAIENQAFYKCRGLNNLIIPNSVTYIGQLTFADCLSLNTINYEGTITQWNSITKVQYWNYNTPATVVHCSDGDVAI